MPSRSLNFICLSAISISVLQSCSDSTSTSLSDTSRQPPSLAVELPSRLFQNRVIDLNNVQLALTLNGEPVPTTRGPDDVWSAQFELPDSGSAQLLATWTESITEINRTRTVTLARSTPIALSTESNRNIVISSSDYTDSPFDFDNDTISNLDERTANTLVTDPRDPGGTGVDCRTAGFNGIVFPAQPFEFVTSREVPFSFSAAEIQLADIPSLALVDQPTYFDTYIVLTPGILTIAHSDGTPIDSASEIFKVINGSLTLIQAEDTADSRSRLQIDVEPGIYCYQLRPGAASADRVLVPGSTLSGFVETP